MMAQSVLASMGPLAGSYGESQQAATSKPTYPGGEEHRTGTSIMAIAYEGGVVMGADCRTSTGNYVANRVSDKLDQVSDRIFVLRSGSAADTQAIGDIVKYYLNLHSVELGNTPAVKTASHLMRDLIYQNKDRLCAGMICGGWDPYEGGSVYEVCAYAGTLVKQKFAIGGSGSSFIYGLVDSQFKEGMSREECEKFVASSLAHAMARDGASGGCIRLVTIDKDGCHRQFIPGDKLPYNMQ